jgi:exonuclease SbcD
LREWAGQPAVTEAWICLESIVVRTGGLLKFEAEAENDGFIGELLRKGMAAAHNPEASKALLNEAMDSLRKQPQIREWLDKRSHEERVQWIHLAMDMSVSLLQDEDAG